MPKPTAKLIEARKHRAAVEAYRKARQEQEAAKAKYWGRAEVPFFNFSFEHGDSIADPYSGNGSGLFPRLGADGQIENSGED